MEKWLIDAPQILDTLYDNDKLNEQKYSYFSYGFRLNSHSVFA